MTGFCSVTFHPSPTPLTLGWHRAKKGIYRPEQDELRKLNIRNIGEEGIKRITTCGLVAGGY